MLWEAIRQTSASCVLYDSSGQLRIKSDGYLSTAQRVILPVARLCAFAYVLIYLRPV